jgi:hypothetical protein
MVMVAFLLLAGFVAVMVVVPGFRAVTAPVLFTDAVCGLEDVHTSVWSVAFEGVNIIPVDILITAPFVPSAFTVRILSAGVVGRNAIFVNGTEQLTMKLAVLPLLVVAVIVAAPADTAVIVPALLFSAAVTPPGWTAATEGFDDVHVI